MIGTYAISQMIPNFRSQVMVPVTMNNHKKLLNKIVKHLLNDKSLNYHVNKSLSDHIFLIQKGFSSSEIAPPLFNHIAPTTIDITISAFLLSRMYGTIAGVNVTAMLTLYAIYSVYMAKPVIKIKTDILEENNKAFENLCESIKRYKSIHDFGKVDYTTKEIDTLLTALFKSIGKAESLSLKIGYGHTIISHAFMLMTCLFMGQKLANSDKYTSHDFLMLFSYFNKLSGLLPSFGHSINHVAAAYPDLKFIFGEITKPSEIIDEHPNEHLDVISELSKNYIEFCNVDFKYPEKLEACSQPKTTVLKNCSFNIEKGNVVAFISKSGGGKTTIFNLLYRYYAQNRGIIKINGQDISKVSLKSVQKIIGLVGQNPNLFKGTIRDNIKFGAINPDEVTDEHIWKLAEEINLSSFLESLDNKLDTDVGEDGKALSNGQQQRVAILRGLLKPCSIRLLDEVTASLDSDSAEKVLSGIIELSKKQGTTCLMITHKLPEAQIADNIIVLNKGKVISSGKHTGLLEDCSIYQNLWQKYISKDSTSLADIALSSSRPMLRFSKPKSIIDKKSSDKKKLKVKPP